MEQIKTYVINLPKDLDRRESILKETATYPWLDVEIVKAVYGKELTEKEVVCSFDRKNYRLRYRRSILPGEIGCTLSHRACYRRLVDSDKALVLILEDDAHFMEGAFTEGFTEAAVRFMNCPEPTVLLLHAYFDYVGRGSFFYDKYLLYPVYNALFTTGYLINKSAAKILLQKGIPYWVADDWLLFRHWGVRVYSLYPSAMIQQWDTFSSSIREKSSFCKDRKFFHCSLIEWRKVYDKLDYTIRKKLGIIRHME